MLPAGEAVPSATAYTCSVALAVVVLISSLSVYTMVLLKLE
jgi:hypothetical protein